MEKKKKNQKKRKKKEDKENARYLQMKVQMEQSKIRKQMETLHCIDSTHNNALADQNKLTNGHKIFVSNNNQRLNFDPSVYFNTSKEIVHNTSNRLTFDQLSNPSSLSLLDKSSSSTLTRSSLLHYWKLHLRLSKLGHLQHSLQSLNFNNIRKYNREKFLVRKKRDVNSGLVVRKSFKCIKQRKR